MSGYQHNEPKLGILSAENVAHYLRANPDFFVSQIQLLADLSLPHQTGAAVSLIERQVDVLREQNRRYRGQLQELVQIARENDKLIGRLHQLGLKMLDCDSLDQILVLLIESMQQDFKADAMVLCLFAKPEQISLDNQQTEFMDIEFIDQDNETISMFDKILAKGEPVCGKLKAEQFDYLFASRMDSNITSAVVLPLKADDLKTKNGNSFGILAIGSHDAERFHAGMGIVILNHLAQLVSRKLIPHFRTSLTN